MKGNKATAELEILRRTPSITQAFRVTAAEREQLFAYAKEHGATISDIIRSALIQVGVVTTEGVE